MSYDNTSIVYKHKYLEAILMDIYCDITVTITKTKSIFEIKSKHLRGSLL